MNINEDHAIVYVVACWPRNHHIIVFFLGNIGKRIKFLCSFMSTYEHIYYLSYFNFYCGYFIPWFLGGEQNMNLLLCVNLSFIHWVSIARTMTFVRGTFCWSDGQALMFSTIWTMQQCIHRYYSNLCLRFNYSEFSVRIYSLNLINLTDR